MAEEYQVTLEEKQDLYFNVFKEEYKNCKKFRNRKRIYFIVSFIAIFFSCQTATNATIKIEIIALRTSFL